MPISQYSYQYLLLVGMLCFMLLAGCAKTQAQPDIPPIPPPSQEPAPFIAEEAPILHEQIYTVGNFGPDDTRIQYQSGSMRLIIPKIQLDVPVLSVSLAKEYEAAQAVGRSDYDTEVLLAELLNQMLDTGVVLFNQAQLPTTGNANVSIAGHRDIAGKEFLHIDNLTDGDVIYLEYNGTRFVYNYRDTKITNDYDWDPVAITNKSQVTLQSCDPPFAKDKQYDRIFVTADLVKVEPITK